MFNLWILGNVTKHKPQKSMPKQVLKEVFFPLPLQALYLALVKADTSSYRNWQYILKKKAMETKRTQVVDTLAVMVCSQGRPRASASLVTAPAPQTQQNLPGKPQHGKIYPPQTC